MLRSFILSRFIPTLSAKEKVFHYTTSISPDGGQAKLNKKDETLLTKTEKAERAIDTIIEHIRANHGEGDATLKVEKLKTDNIQENSDVEQNQTSQISCAEATNVNSNVEPIHKNSFAERAKAGFPKKLMPSELPNKWEKPKEKLQLFDSSLY